ncbi:transglutaminase domain-containing protein [Streptomyces sp. H27-C3]|uniref:transglutaminase domain-containing protein n=1 Tax=Streptomyces sp. H27-C3 TaxID=3046305 RepID=UPI0024BA04CD|nr:transglutaminase domain-containing protein [Streptomyces sp. H27-C3]MDJ0462520.1 transglutaminase domain-containing protein [Streptomyces sp. H27-C3]
MVTPVGSATRDAHAPGPDQLDDLVGQLRQVPDRQRRFSVTGTGVRRLYRIRPELLSALITAGLPHVGEGPDRLYDGYDLGNAALHLGLVSVQSRSMRSWARALQSAGTPGPRLRVEIVSSCPVPGHPGPCPYGVLLRDGRRLIQGPAADAHLTELAVSPVAQWPALPDAVRGLLREVDGIGFFLLPEAVRWDAEFMWRTRMADCGGAAAWLVAEGTRRGLAVRFSFGLLVAKPYSTPHCWAEFLVDGVWVPVDPLLVRALNQWGGLDAQAFPPDGRPGALFHRLTDRFTKVVSHGGIWAQVSLPTEPAA